MHSSGTNLKSGPTARYLNGGFTFEMSCTPMDIFFRLRPNPQCKSSCNVIRDLMLLEFRRKPRTTAHARCDLIGLTDFSIVTAMSDFSTSYSGSPVSIPKKPRIALAKPSTLNKSGLSGKNSMSTCSSSMRSMSAPIMGILLRIVSLSAPISFSRSSYCKVMIGMLTPFEVQRKS